MKRRITWTLILVTVLALASCQITATKNDYGKHDLRIVTLNIYHDKAEWPKRKPQIIAKLRELQPDAIALQEVIQTEETVNQAQDIANALGYSMHFVSTDPEGQVRRYGNAILTKNPMHRTAETKLRPLNDSRTAAFAGFGDGQRKIAFFATHLNYENNENGQKMRREQTKDLITFITANRGDATVIVAGDFNTVAYAPELNELSTHLASGYDAIHPDAKHDELAHTTLNPAYFSKKEDLRRIDHVFFDEKKLRSINASRLFTSPDANGIYATDHYGMMVDLSWR